MKLSGFFIVFIVIIVEIAFCKLNAGEKHKNELCRERRGFSFDSHCYLPVLNTYCNYTSSQQVCEFQGAKLAALKHGADDKVFKHFLRMEMNPKYFAGFWVDATYLGNGTQVSFSDGDVIDLQKSWRFLYPRPESSRSNVVLEVWDVGVSEVNLLEGFKNVPAKAHYNVLCEL